MWEFDNAISIMCEHARAIKRADDLTIECSAFNSFDDLLKAKGNYRPSLSRSTPAARELGRLYDAAQIALGDARRAFMYGTPSTKGSILDRGNYDTAEHWYAQGSRRAWWDRYTRQWIVYTVCAKGYQVGAADFYRNRDDLLRMEECHD